MPFPNRENLRMMIIFWVIAGLALLWSQWTKKRAAGLPLAYAFVLSLNHLAAACVYAKEGYQPRSALLIQGQYSLLDTFTGFYVTVIGFSSFVFGCLICPILFNKEPKRVLKHQVPEITKDLPVTLLLISILFFFVMRPILNRIPSFAAIASSGTYMSVVAVTFIIFYAYQDGNYTKAIKWMLSTFAFPTVTILTMGFAGFGSVAAVVVWMLVLRFFKPRWPLVIALITLFYIGGSVYVNYMRERDSIRESVWGGRDLSSRLSKFAKLAENLEFFDFNNQRHLEMVDMRMNQNELVGKAVIYIESGRVQLAEGGTFAAAAVAWIPRILWPDKPATGGSGSIVSRFTGTKFAEGTSVGVGQPFEFYVNWKLPSEIIAFILFGLALTYIDQKAGAYMNHGDLWHAACWLVPGLGMLQAAGSSTEIVSSVAGGAVFMWALNHYVFSRYYGDMYMGHARSDAFPTSAARPQRGSRIERQPVFRR